MSRLINALKKYGLKKTIGKLPRFMKSRIKKFKLHPSFITRYGVSEQRWSKFQIKHELDFWENNGKYDQLDGFTSFREKYLERNKRKFNNIKLDFPDGIAVDVGCGPEGGFLPYIQAKCKIGVDPLAEKYQKKYSTEKDIIMIATMAEKIPLVSESVDACFCVNTLDHVMRPYTVLSEIYRILKPNGYLAFSVDVGGTKMHPVKIFESDLDDFFSKNNFRVIEKRCSTQASAWGEEAGVPLYVFQGIKTRNGGIDSKN